MEKIDRLGWAAGISLEVFGLKLGIRVCDPAILDRLLSRVPAGWIPSQTAVVDRLYSVVTPSLRRGNIRQLCVLYGDHGRLARTERIEELVETFEADLDFYIASSSRRCLFVHAGAVEWRGQAIVIPGRSRTGKTTLVAEFLKRGAAYYADDFVAIDTDGYLHSYPRPLSVRMRNRTAKRVFPDELGARCAQVRPVSFVFVTQYLEEASWKAERISAGQGVLSLMENTPSSRKHPDFALDVLQQAVRGAEIWKGHRGESEQAVDELERHLDRGGTDEQSRQDGDS